MDADAVLTTSVYHNSPGGMFPNSDYGDILSGRHVVGKYNGVDRTEACPGTDHIRYRSTGWSGRVKQVSQDAEHV